MTKNLKLPPDKKDTKSSDHPTDEYELGKRSDKKIACWEKNFFRYHTVKMKLSSFLKEKSLRPVISEAVNSINHIVYLAYHLLNFHFLRILNDPTKIHLLPKKLDQNDIYRACTSVSLCRTQKAKNANPYWDQSVKLFKKALNKEKKYKLPKRDKYCNLINNMTKTMLTSINNHFQLNFRSRLTKYLRAKHNEDDLAKAHYWSDRILNYRQINSDYPSKFDNNPNSEKIISTYRNELKISNEKQPDISSQLDIYLPFYFKILQFLEKQEMKVFSILPHKGQLTGCFIKICNKSFAELLDIYLNSKNTWKKMSKHKRMYWKKYFNLRRIETKKYRFANEIVTNGYDVSILISEQFKSYPEKYQQICADERSIIQEKLTKTEMKQKLQQILVQKCQFIDKEREKKPKIKSQDTNKFQGLCWDEYIEYLGLDPGRRNLFSASNGDTQNSTQVRCTAKEWKDLTGEKRFRKLQNIRKDKNDLVNSLSAFSFKTSEPELYLTHLKNISPSLPKLFKFYNKSFYKKVRFTTYIRRQKAFAKIVQRLDLGKDLEVKTIIGFGNGSVNTNGPCKGGKVPVKGLYRKLDRSPNIIVGLVCEANTTKMCNLCQKVTGPMYKWKEVKCLDGTKKTVKSQIHGLRRCQNNECRITWDRDTNAERNIYRVTVNLIKDGSRPEYLKTVKKSSKDKKKDYHNKKMNTGT